MKKKENDEIRITPDALISLVVTEAEERELASMPSLKEMNAQFHPSEQFQKKMDRLLKKAHRKEGWVQIWKPTKKVLIAFTSVMTALTFALLPVQAFQDAVVDKAAHSRMPCDRQTAVPAETGQTDAPAQPVLWPWCAGWCCV